MHERMLYAINAAYRFALKSTQKQKVGACITTSKFRAVCVSWNKKKTHTLMCNALYRDDQKYRHAEVDAISKLNNTNVDLIMTVVRVLRDGTMGLSKPCPGCLDNIKRVGIKTILYIGTDRQWHLETFYD